MWTTSFSGLGLGVVPFAVGGPLAVLVAEELASRLASGAVCSRTWKSARSARSTGSANGC
jgi:hypothetical protein